MLSFFKVLTWRNIMGGKRTSFGCLNLISFPTSKLPVTTEYMIHFHWDYDNIYRNSCVWSLLHIRVYSHRASAAASVLTLPPTLWMITPMCIDPLTWIPDPFKSVSTDALCEHSLSYTFMEIVRRLLNPLLIMTLSNLITPTIL